MKPQSPKLHGFHKFIRGLIREALANKFGQGGDMPAAENVANSHWGSVYNVMPKGEAKNEVFYRVQLHNSSGPVKYLKQDSQGRWFFMEPPALQWRPVNPAKVPQATAEATECKDCGCGDPNDAHDELPDAMNGDTTDVHTMDTANLGEAVNYRASTDELVKAFVAWKHSTPAEVKSHNAVAFTAGYNSCLAAQKQTGLNESANGKFEVYLTYLSRGDEKHRMFNSNASTEEEASAAAAAYMQSIAKANRIPPDSIKVLSVRKGGLNEMTSSGAVFSGGPTIQTPNAFSKKGSGSKKAMDATKKTGYKPVKKEY